MFVALCLRIVVAITNCGRGDDPGRDKSDYEMKSMRRPLYITKIVLLSTQDGGFIDVN